MKTTQYVRQEKAIATADAGGMRERWLWGIRLLRDPDAFSAGSTQLKPGRTDELVAAAKSAGRALSEREIRRRLQCARAYRTESEFGRAVAEFPTWRELSDANFPQFDSPDGEPDADYRTDGERERDRRRAYADILSDQDALFPLSDFEPSMATLKELVDFTDEMEAWTGRYVARDKKRREYLDALILAVDDDLSVTWLEAQRRRNGGAA